MTITPADPARERRVYLDHAATAPLRPEARAAMHPYFGEVFGNPSGLHSESRRARRAVDDAREEIAALLGADFGEIVFTGSGTEADNLAITGALDALEREDSSPPVVVCSQMEHHAVLASCRALDHAGRADLREVPSDKDGIVDLDALARACTPEVALVSVMAVNNEIGTVQPIGDVVELVHERSPTAVIHTDAVQAAPWFDVAELTGGVDLVAVSAHKFGGPKGVGVLLVRHGVRLRPLIEGGGQERGRRSGTANVAGIVGSAAALAATGQDRGDVGGRVAAMRDRLATGLVGGIAGAAETGDPHRRAPGHLHLRIAGIEGEALVVLLDRLGIAISAGAACSSGAAEVSHVLTSMGLDGDEAAGGVRFSLGPSTEDGDVDLALAVVPDAVAQLRD